MLGLIIVIGAVWYFRYTDGGRYQWRKISKSITRTILRVSGKFFSTYTLEMVSGENGLKVLVHLDTPSSSWIQTYGELIAEEDIPGVIDSIIDSLVQEGGDFADLNEQRSAMINIVTIAFHNNTVAQGKTVGKAIFEF